jgi:hypothetical protein
MAWNSRPVTLTVTTTATGQAGAELAVLVRAIREALPVLGLRNDDDPVMVETQLQGIEEELECDEPDQALVVGMLKRAVATIGGAADSSLTLLLTARAKDLMRDFNLEPAD